MCQMFFKYLGIKGQVIILWTESAHDPKYSFFTFSTFSYDPYLGHNIPYWAMFHILSSWPASESCSSGISSR